MLNDDNNHDPDLHHDALAYWIDNEIARWHQFGIRVTVREAFKFYLWSQNIRD